MNDQITAIVRKKASWILRKEAGYSELGSTPPPREFVSGETFHYLGRAYRLKVVPDGNAVLTRIVARGSGLIAQVPIDAADLVRRATVRSGLRHWYRGHSRMRPAPITASHYVAPSPEKKVPKSVELMDTPFIVGHDGFKRAPEASRMVVLQDVAHLVRYHVIYQRHRRHDQTPVKTDTTARVATTPSFRLIDDDYRW